jgi:hypothetical protein
MIKKIAITLFFMLASGIGITGCAGMDDAVRLTIEPSEQAVNYVDKFELDKNQIYDRSLSWVTQAFNSSKTVVDLKDREAGLISIHAVDYTPVALTRLPYKYSIQIRIKDKKTKLTFTVDGMDTQYGGYPPKNSIKFIHANFSSLHSSYALAVNSATNADDF